MTSQEPSATNREKLLGVVVVLTACESLSSAQKLQQPRNPLCSTRVWPHEGWEQPAPVQVVAAEEQRQQAWHKLLGLTPALVEKLITVCVGQPPQAAELAGALCGEGGA